MKRRCLFPLPLLPLLAVVLVAGCTTSRLHKNDFEGRRIAATAAFPPKPMVHNDFLAASGVYPHAPASRPATGIAQFEEERVNRLQGLLEAATKRVDLAERIAREALLVSTDRLGAIIAPTPDEADYVLDLRVYHYGLLMRSYDTEANFYIDAELLVRDPATDEILWKKRLDRAGTYETRLTSGAMAHLTEAELAHELEQFAAFAAQRMTAALTRTIKKG